MRIGGDVAQRNLISNPAPKYPALAQAARVQDYVMLQATIDKAGTIVDLKILRGHPLLNEAALEAVKQWRYQPFLLNGVATDVVTTITVNFSLQ
jgi:protein TonB